MKTFITLTLVFIICFALSTFADELYDIQIEKINDHFYRLAPEVYQVYPTIILFVSDEGTLLVDTGVKETKNTLKGIVDSLGNGTPKYILNSHMHRDHTGANGFFGAEPIIIARKGVRDLLLAPRFAMDEFPPEAMPDIEFDDSLTLHFGGEVIKMFSLPTSHSDNDALIYFSNSKIAYLGDIAFGLEFPSVDGACGDATKFADAVGMVLDILPDDAIMVAGHGRIMTNNELVEYHRMLVDATKAITDGLKAGKDTTELVAQNILAKWDSYGQGEISTETFLNDVARDALGYKSPKPLGPELYYAFKENGIDAAIDKYWELKKAAADKYMISVGGLCQFGDFLLFKNDTENAIKMYTLAVQEYPDDWIPTYYFGYAYLQLGKPEEARKKFERGLKLDPGNKYLLEELEKLNSAK